MHAPARLKLAHLPHLQFHSLCSLFPFVDTARKMKIQLSNVTGKLKLAAVMHNWHVCAYGNQLSYYFAVTPPSLDEYFAVV